MTRRNWRKRAEEWMKAHPQVMQLFESLALDAARRGHTFGIGALTERVRWHYRVEIERDGEEFKINNNYRAYIARELVRRHPELEALIVFRATADEDLQLLEEVPR